jgi:choline kinase
MKAIILSAGQGKRLLPLTEKLPKAAIPINAKALIDWQIDGLRVNAIDRVVVVTGYEAERLDRLLALPGTGTQAQTIHNPEFDKADNLVSCWMARGEMTEDFVLLNGDTLFEPSVLRRLLDAPRRPVVMAIDKKPHYDADDMKIQRQGERLLRVGKDLPIDKVDGESIGMMVFRGEGRKRFRQALDQAVLSPEAKHRWYLSVLDEMAAQHLVWTYSIHGLGWAEIDYPLDLVRASKMVGSWSRGTTRASFG